MPRPRYVALALLAWVVAEILAFAFVTSVVGFWGAVLIGLATSLAGAMQAKRLGLDVTKALRRMVAGGAIAEASVLDGVLSGLGAALLLAPGFLTDLVGLALAAPSVRQSIVRRYATPDGRSGPAGVIDLERRDWSRLDRSLP